MSKLSDIRGVTAADGTTKAKIERAAITLFAERGVDAVTTREIAAATGVSEGALYRHYNSKEELAETLFFAIHRRLAEEINEAASASGGIADKTRAIVAAYCQAADDDWALFSYHVLAAHRFLPAIKGKSKKENDSPVAAVEAIIATAMSKGELPKGDAAVKAAMSLGAVLQTALHTYYGRISGDLSTHKPQLEKAVLAILKS